MSFTLTEDVAKRQVQLLFAALDVVVKGYSANQCGTPLIAIGNVTDAIIQDRCDYPLVVFQILQVFSYRSYQL